GAGGMGEVFAAHDAQLDRIVALKLLKTEGSGEARARFQREARAMARLNHPNVVSVFDAGVARDRMFVAMERIEGPTLADWLAAGPRSWREIVDVFAQAGRGLEAAHAAGIVPRDFKPSNVILGDRRRVADVGLARAVAEATDDVAGPTPDVLEAVVTEAGRTIGTPAYMAPEQRAGSAVTAASDQYAFCVALHEALYEARPGDPAPRRRVPGFLQAVVARGLASRPEDRYPSMRALVADLARGRARARRPWLAGAAGMAALAAAAYLAARPRPEPDWLPVELSREQRTSGIKDITISRDGATLAYVTADEVMIEPRAGGARVHLALPKNLGRP